MDSIVLQMIEAFKSLGYFGITLALTFEFIPAEVVLPLAGYWVYEGDRTLLLSILFGSIGGVTGPLTVYALGRFGGRPLILKYGKYFLIKEAQVDKADAFFQKYGGSIAFFGRFVPGVRTAVSLPCGMTKMNVWAFMGYTFLAMFPVTCVYVYLGYRLGPKWEDAGGIFAEYANYLIIPIVLIVVFMFVRHRRNKTKTLNK